jgi:hypothetical protein
MVLAPQMQIERLVESIKAHRIAVDMEARRLRTPVILASISTDQKNLELDEFVLFLKYIEVKIMELVEHARRYPRVAI